METQATLVECEVLPGLEAIAEGEIRRRLRDAAEPLALSHGSAIALRYWGELDRLLQLRTVVAAHLVLRYRIPRPLALLGDQNLRELLASVDVARSLHAPGAFRTLHVDAAGRDSPALLRIRQKLANETGLTDDPAAGDLEIRLRRARIRLADGADEGWEVLIRLSPRPLSVRQWRLHNLPGAANATVASAMADLSRPRPTDRYLNLLCGSGTLLVERLLRAPAEVAIGVDLDPTALAQAEDHVRAARLEGVARLAAMDATALELPSGSFDSLAADLPWGQLTGSHRENASLYPRVLAETRRVAAPGARLVLLTHEVSLLERILPEFADRWRVDRVIRILQGGLHPRIYLLSRVG